MMRAVTKTTPMKALSERLSRYGRNLAVLHRDNAAAFTSLLDAGLSIQPIRERAVLKWQLFGEALVLSISGAAIGIKPVHTHHKPFFVAYARQEPQSTGTESSRGALLIDGGGGYELPYADGAETILVGTRETLFGVPLTPRSESTLTGGGYGNWPLSM